MFLDQIDNSLNQFYGMVISFCRIFFKIFSSDLKVSAFSELKSAGHVTETEILASQEYRPNPFFGVYMFSFESFSAKMDSSSTRSLDVGLAMAESSGLSAFMASAFSPLAIQFLVC